jgi:hypothetical protein
LATIESLKAGSKKRHSLLRKREATTSKSKERVEITKFGSSFRQQHDVIMKEAKSKKKGHERKIDGALITKGINWPSFKRELKPPTFDHHHHGTTEINLLTHRIPRSTNMRKQIYIET